MLLRGGTPVVTALDMASGLLAPALQPSLARAREAIREGRAISESMSAHGLTTPVALRMLRVGERSGRMDEIMDRIAGFLDEEIARWVDWFTRLFEPLLMVFIGVVIGVIVDIDVPAGVRVGGEHPVNVARDVLPAAGP